MPYTGTRLAGSQPRLANRLYRVVGRFRPALATLACMWLAAGAGAAPAPDAALLGAARDLQPFVLQTLRDLVQIESGSRQPDGLRAIAEKIEHRLRALGAAVERHPLENGTAVLQATLHGSGRSKVLLLAHMDTVHQPGVLREQPWREEGGRAYGPGAADDKGGVALILGVLQLLQSTGQKDFQALSVLFNPDEEIGSPGSNALITELAAQHDVVLSFEPTTARALSPHHMLLLGTAGIAHATLVVAGRAAHAGNSPQDGANALYELAHRMLQTRALAEQVPGVSLNWTVAATDGNAVNQIPARAHAVADVRITKPGAEQAIEAALLRAAGTAPLIDGTQTSLAFTLHRPMFQADARGVALAGEAEAIYRDELGRDLVLVSMVGGGTDAAFAARSGKPVVLESLGLAGANFHADGEYVEIDSIVPRLYLVVRLLQKIEAQAGR